MCHTVNVSATAPRKRYAYKIVKREGSKLSSIHSENYTSRKTFWVPGRTVRARKPLFSGFLTADKRRSEAGIYVFLTLGAVKAYANANSSLFRAVIKVEIDPADWLTTSTCGYFATYRKAKMVEETRIA